MNDNTFEAMRRQRDQEIAEVLAIKEQLVNTKVAAEILGVAVRTLEGWRQKGIGPPIKKIGKKIRYRLSDLRACLEGSPLPSKAGADGVPPSATVAAYKYAVSGVGKAEGS